MESIARLVNLASLIVEHRKFLISFNLEKLLSHEATDTQTVKKYRKHKVKLCRDSQKSNLTMNSKNCKAVHLCASSTVTLAATKCLRSRPISILISSPEI